MDATSGYLNRPVLSYQQRQDVTAADNARQAHAMLVAALVKRLHDEPESLRDAIRTEDELSRRVTGGWSDASSDDQIDEAVDLAKGEAIAELTKQLEDLARDARDDMDAGLQELTAEYLTDAADAYETLAAQLRALAEAAPIIEGKRK